MVPRARGGGLDGETKSLIATERDEAARAGALWADGARRRRHGPLRGSSSATSAARTRAGRRSTLARRAASGPTATRRAGRNTTRVAALTLGGGCDSMAVEGAMDREAFVAWLAQGLGPKRVAGQVVVMDNLSVHKGERVRAAIEGDGCRLRFLPAYSPDMTLIEGMFSKVKAALRRAGTRTQEGLVAVIGAALDAVTAADAAGWFAAAGYPPATGQPL